MVCIKVLSGRVTRQALALFLATEFEQEYGAATSLRADGGLLALLEATA
jgi:hypothetical protein